MNTVRSMFAGAALLALPAEAQEHRFEDDPVVMVRENFVACDVLSQLQRVMDNPRFLLSGECDPVRAGDRVRVYARRGPYVCIYRADLQSVADRPVDLPCAYRPADRPASVRPVRSGRRIEDRGSTGVRGELWRLWGPKVWWQSRTGGPKSGRLMAR